MRDVEPSPYRMELGSWTTLVAMSLAPLSSGAEGGARSLPAFDQAPATHDAAPAAALVFGPLHARSPEGGLRVTVVASHANTSAPRAVRALVAREGAFVEWVPLPTDRLPESIILPDDETIVCVERDEAGETFLLTLDGQARLQARRALADVLPAGATRAPDAPISLAESDEGRCLAVPMGCGGVALVHYATAHGEDYALCSVILSPRHACGIDAWLEQGRELMKSGDVEAARFALEAAIETDPQDARGYRELARFHARAGDRDAQLACLQDGLDRIHADVDGAVTDDWQVGTPGARLALEYVEATRAARGDCEAHGALDETLALYPCMEQAVLLRAELLLAADQDEAAVQSLRDALAQLGPEENVAAAYHDVGRFLRRHRRTAEALRFLEDAYALGDTSEFLIRGIADLHLDSGDPLMAAEWLSRLAEQWRACSNGDSELERRLRGYRRLAELEQEIERLHGLATQPDPR